MAVQLDTNGKDDLKTQFITREGTYRLMTSEYRPNRVGYTSNQSTPQVRVSIVSLPQSLPVQQTQQLQQQGQTSNLINGQEPNYSQGGDRICFNFGKEIFVYAYRGVKKAADLSKPIDKKLYKGTNPSCHDFNSANTTNDGAPLLVGFTTGQIQLVQPGKREPGKLYNEERLIDKTKVTCLKWLPGSSNLFLASHSSGYLYLYNEELPCTPTSPNYQPFKIGDGYTILTCKSKSTRNPLYKWTFGTDNCSINEFCFSPCGSNLAIVSQDGFLRVFHYDTMELLGIARSYFGGFLCVCWSPDGKYIVVGGEDDLVTVWSLNERRVVARGQGHRSWVSVVAFDPYTTSYTNWDGPDFSDDENPINESNYNNRFNNDNNHQHNNSNHNGDLSDLDGSGDNINLRHHNHSSSTTTTTQQQQQHQSLRDSNLQQQPDKLATSYRLGSVSQDTQLCLWDITEDILRQPIGIRHRLSSYDPQQIANNCDIQQQQTKSNDIKLIKPIAMSSSSTAAAAAAATTTTTTTTTTTSTTQGGIITGKEIDKLSININKFQPITTITPTQNCSSNNDNNKYLNNCNKNNSRVNNCISNNIDVTSTTTVPTTTIINTQNNVILKSNDVTTTSSTSSVVGGNGGGGGSGSSGSSGGSSGISAFNTLTQRLSNFSFGSEKNKTGITTNSTITGTTNEQYNNHNKNKHFTLTKTINNTLLNHNNNSSSNNTDNQTQQIQTIKNSKSFITNYDPMCLIGTPICPRFDDCHILEPLVCKKIAHERLTALIFREDCFLTACQDGFIYTWARPGFTNVPQHNIHTSGGAIV